MEQVRFRGLIWAASCTPSMVDVCSELFFDELDHKEQIIGEAKITGFCLS
ncbi:hypothetical protein F2Q69_00009904 [Brassica cretica]|uniref:Uncharacterized protein n=1 Tax=Brassica cretica TaxID=69181 RepID=A0A8S9PAP1_BRACR|nr:hypothetical protein F2Q69_00009904 [Brassica cretica]